MQSSDLAKMIEASARRDKAQGKAKTWSAVRAVLAPALALTYKHAKFTKVMFFLSSKAKQALAVYEQTRVKSHSQLLYRNK